MPLKARFVRLNRVLTTISSTALVYSDDDCSIFNAAVHISTDAIKLVCSRVKHRLTRGRRICDNVLQSLLLMCFYDHDFRFDAQIVLHLSVEKLKLWLLRNAVQFPETYATYLYENKQSSKVTLNQCLLLPKFRAEVNISNRLHMS